MVSSYSSSYPLGHAAAHLQVILRAPNEPRLPSLLEGLQPLKRILNARTPVRSVRIVKVYILDAQTLQASRISPLRILRARSQLHIRPNSKLGGQENLLPIILVRLDPLANRTLIVPVSRLGSVDVGCVNHYGELRGVGYEGIEDGVGFRLGFGGTVEGVEAHGAEPEGGDGDGVGCASRREWAGVVQVG